MATARKSKMQTKSKCVRVIALETIAGAGIHPIGKDKCAAEFEWW